MKRMNEFISWARNGLNKSISAMEKELLLPPIVIPEVYNIKKAHQTLLMEYMHVITGVSRSPFFMSPIHKTRAKKKMGLFRRLLVLVLMANNPIRLITLRPLVSLLIEIHVRNKLNELEIAYTQLKYTIPADYYDRDSLLKWLEQAKLDCSQLKNTVSSGKLITDAIRQITIPVIGLLLAFFGVSSIYDLVVKLISTNMIVQYTTLFVTIGIVALLFFLYGSIFIENTFEAKRSIFSNLGNERDSRSLYVMENSLFDLLGRSKVKEFALDYFFVGLYCLIQIGLLSWVAFEIDRLASSSGNANNINCGWGFVILLGIGIIIFSILPWWRRDRSREV